MTIQSKLILALTGLGLGTCLALYLFMQWSFDRGLISYVNEQEKASKQALTEALSHYYRQNSNWQEFANNPRSYHRLVREYLPRKQTSQGGNTQIERRPPEHRPPPDRRRFYGNTPRENRPPPRRGPPPPTLLEADKSIIVGRHNPQHLVVPIKLDGVTVGWLSFPKPPYPLEQYNFSLKENLDLAFLVLAVVLSVSVFGIGIPLSRHFVSPLKQLTYALNALTKGKYTTDLKVNRRDEIGQLAKDVRILAETLKSNESSRSRWIAGISHELRTPLAITLGEVEAMMEDIRPLTKDNLLSVKEEVDQLNRLINDLYELSNAEIGALRYHMVRLDLRDVVANGTERFEELMADKNLNLKLSLPKYPVFIDADVQRLNQLMNNLLTNEIKYAQTYGNVHLSLTINKNIAALKIEDSGPGVAPDQLDKLFDHLYRVDASYTKKVSGSGLGLAICKKIVEAHIGTIEAQASPLGGIAIYMNFPLSD
ncbi:ATP-binding protein [Agarilytica rhodophyticola]|uniref:ATP-binding protein n=1 Tax=Agarilytica rhodophyticola TaxID=1737490 RepID=UPI000B346F2E|nr:ATP-binding protein [Agarilytica rhodophyticola]